MSKDEALKLALEYVELVPDDRYNAEHIDREALVTAIKEALSSEATEMSGTDGAQPKQEQLMSDQINYGMSVTQNGKRIDPMSIYKEPEQEPVTWRYKIVDVFGRPAWTLKTPKSDTRVLESQPLYTTPPQRTWVNATTWRGLTDEERDAMIDSTDLSGAYYYDDLYAVILAAEAKLKEKNT